MPKRGASEDSFSLSSSPPTRRSRPSGVHTESSEAGSRLGGQRQKPSLIVTLSLNADVLRTIISAQSDEGAGHAARKSLIVTLPVNWSKYNARSGAGNSQEPAALHSPVGSVFSGLSSPPLSEISQQDAEGMEENRTASAEELDEAYWPPEVSSESDSVIASDYQVEPDDGEEEEEEEATGEEDGATDLSGSEGRIKQPVTQAGRGKRARKLMHYDESSEAESSVSPDNQTESTRAEGLPNNPSRPTHSGTRVQQKKRADDSDWREGESTDSTDSGEEGKPQDTKASRKRRARQVDEDEPSGATSEVTSDSEDEDASTARKPRNTTGGLTLK